MYGTATAGSSTHGAGFCSIARAGAVLIAIALLDGPPVFVPALLAAPLLIEPVLYDDNRVGMALVGAYFVAALAVLGTREAAVQPATAHYLATFRAGHRSARRAGLDGRVPS